MIVDCHTHLNSYSNDPLDIEGAISQLLGEMATNKVDQALVLTSYTVNEQRPSSEEVYSYTRNMPDLHVVEGIPLLDEKRPVDWGALDRRLELGTVVGLKLYPGYEHFYPQEGRCEPVYELAAKHGVPVMIHTGDTFKAGAKVKYSMPLHLDEVAVDHPDVNLIMCHLGNPWLIDAAEVLYKNENVYADISGLTLGAFETELERHMAQQVKEMVHYVGDPDSLLYGTDWPIAKMSSYLRFFSELGFEGEAREKVLWRNAVDLFGLDTPAELKAELKAEAARARQARAQMSEVEREAVWRERQRQKMAGGGMRAGERLEGHGGVH